MLDSDRKVHFFGYEDGLQSVVCLLYIDTLMASVGSSLIRENYSCLRLDTERRFAMLLSR